MTDLDSLVSRVSVLLDEGDADVLDFLGIMCTCGGKVSLSGWDYSFSTYIQGHPLGKERFDRVKAILIQRDAILDEGVNEFGNNELRIRHEDPQIAARRLGDLLFERRRAHYLAVLAPLLSSPNGRHVLRDLAEVAPHFSNATVEHLSSALGYETSGPMIAYLQNNHLLLSVRSSRKNSYYSFPIQIRELLPAETVTQAEVPLSASGPQPTRVTTPPELPGVRASEVYKITFPPYDDGTTLVFGRGALANKIAWGFESGKEPGIESLVVSDLHDINQPHVGSFQQTRTGKSTLAGSVILQVAFQGVPVVVIDPKPDYVSSLIPVARLIEALPDLGPAIQQRFADAHQDLRGFDLSRPVPFEYEGKRRSLRFQVFSFDRELQGIPNCRVLKLPLLILPSLDDADFEDQCNAVATNLIACLNLPKRAYNALLADIVKAFKRTNPTREWLLKGDLDELLRRHAEGADRGNIRKISTLVDAFNDYYTANSYLYASQESELVTMEAVVRNPEHDGGDGETVTISVIDVSSLPQERHNPVLLNYVSQVCGQLYGYVRRKRSRKPVQVCVVFDEAQNYLPNPSDQYNYARVIINRGASLGIKSWLIAQSPQEVEIEARRQFSTLVLAGIDEASVRNELSKFVQSDAWRGKLSQTGLGSALVVNAETGKTGGTLCVPFSTPQTVDILSSRQVNEFMRS